MGSFTVMGSDNGSFRQPMLQKSGSALAHAVSVRESCGRSTGWESAAYWGYTLFAMKGRAKPVVPMAFYTVYTCAVVAWLMIRVPGFNTLKELNALSIAVGMIGTSLFLLQAFRVNSSYDRWWEGRKLWDNIAAGSSNLGRLSLVWVKDRALTARLMRWVMAFAYAAKDQLRHTHDLEAMECILTPEDMNHWRGARSKPKYALLMISQCIREASEGTTMPSGITCSMDTEVRNLLSALGSCSRLKHTPIPLAYVIHLRSFLVLWLGALPFIFAPEMHWWAIGVCIVVGYQLLGFEEIGVEIESPFGTDDNDIDLDLLAGEIRVDLLNKLEWLKSNSREASAV